MKLEERLKSFRGEQFSDLMRIVYFMNKYLVAQKVLFQQIFENSERIIIPEILRVAYSLSEKPPVITYYGDFYIELKPISYNFKEGKKTIIQGIKYCKSNDTIEDIRYFDIQTGNEIR